MIYRHSFPSSVLIAIAALAAEPELLVAQTSGDLTMPERVQFGSADGKTTLVGYAFKPTVQRGFGPRGYPQGFGRHTYATRPAELDEVGIRPLDAYGALAYLRARPDVLTDRIGLHGWSNGGSATLASMAPDAPGLASHAPDAGFRAALAFYPACGLKDHFAATGYRSYAPLRIFVGTADEEISPGVCRELLVHAGGDVQIHFYKGATHDFDDPGRKRQSIPANADAWRDVVRQASAFFASELGRK